MALSPLLRRTPWAAHPQAAHGTHTKPENHMSPIECVRCRGTAGPFVRHREGPVCEDCLTEQDGAK